MVACTIIDGRWEMRLCLHQPLSLGANDSISQSDHAASFVKGSQL
jgi:hypothetical protein